MINSRKKGFTLVELVIVIAVIAILAAVLIPTFSSLIRKANISSDTVLAKNLNTALQVYDAEKDVKEFDDALKGIKEHGYLIANLNAKTTGCFFVWEKDTNQILLVDSKDGYKVLFSVKDGYGTPDESWHFAISNKDIATQVSTEQPYVTIKQTVASSTDLKDWISSDETQTIYIDESINVNTQEQIQVDGGDITIKLTGATISGNKNDGYSVENIPFLVKSGTLTLEGGVINATGSLLDADGEPIDAAVQVDGGIVNLVNTTIDGTGKDCVVGYTGGNGTLSNSKFIAHGQAIGAFRGSNIVLDNCDVNVEYEALFVSNHQGVSYATIKSGTYKAGGNTIVTHGGHIVIEDGEFSSTNYNLFKFYSSNGSITLKGGTYTSNGNKYTFDQLTVDIIKSMIATTSDNYNSISVVKNSDGSFKINN